MTLSIENTRKLLQSFDFKTLFIEELGWNNPRNKSSTKFHLKDSVFQREEIAELSGAVVYEITNDEGTIPDSKIRSLISREVQKISFEHILIFLDKGRTQSVWLWLKKQEKKTFTREHFFSKGQTGDLFISKLSKLLVDLSEIENDITIVDVAKKIQESLDVQKVTKKFYNDYQSVFVEFIEFIAGIEDEADRKWYASVILNRLMFIYFLQKKLFLDNKNASYLADKLKYSKEKLGKNKFYSVFLNTLFFEGFAKKETERSKNVNNLIGKIKYLNGGLFLEHKIEIKYENISIADDAFDNLFKLFDKYSWTLDDTPGGKDDEINPDVLGYIFEKYINQKAFGAYYTRPEITEYLCEQTIYKLILDEINDPEVNAIDSKFVNEKTKELLKPKRFENIAELLLNLNPKICRKLVADKDAVLTNLSLLDPACGSGAFLVAAMKTLINVYSAVLGKIDFLGDKKLNVWKKEIQNNHPSINYYIKKQIITNNLYGVDIMEEATEIAKLRLFLALVSSAETIEQLEPLPNIDFNIMNGNSLIGLLRVNEDQFNKHISEKSSKKEKGKVVKSETFFQPSVIQSNIFAEQHAKSYQQLINEKEAAIRAYKNTQNLGNIELQSLRDDIQKQENKSYEVLNNLLKEEFDYLGIKYGKITWDEEKNKEEKPKKRSININDINSLEPFHWGYDFSEIFRTKNGFDAIITNPPWETFQPNAKEFLMSFSDKISKKKMDIKEFKDEFQILMKNLDIRELWLKYKSDYSYLREYFRCSTQYGNQVPVINGKRHGKDVNFYKLFLEQSFNLLREGGYCGIVIPSAIYSDLGSKQLREMLFEHSKVTGIFCFENRNEIFEGVHRMYKFVVLSFEKGQKTSSFPVAFMRHDVDELSSFPENGSINLSLDFVKRQSPNSLSIMEVKNKIDFEISDKLLAFPIISSTNGNSWEIVLHREFNMTDDANLFHKTPPKNSLPLFEGKMIFNFTHLLSDPRYWINEKEGRKALLGKNKDQNQILGYQKYRLAYRSVAASTNERTLVSTIIPPCFTGNSLNVSENLDYNNLLYCQSIFSSFVLDWFLRQQVSTNINIFYIYQLPVPRLGAKDKLYNPIIERASKLICTTNEFADLWEEVMKTKWNIKRGITDESERNKLRAELDGIIAHIYRLTEEEFKYILGTFPLVAQEQKDACLKVFTEISK